MNKPVRYQLVLFLAIVVVNVLSTLIFVRMDCTSNNRYSLSMVSKQTVQANTSPITVDFYVTKELPQELNKIAKEFVFQLKEYQSLSRVDFKVNTLHPDNDIMAHKAIQAGIQPLLFEVKDNDMEQIENIYMGAVFHFGGKKAVLPLINADTPLEYEITRLLKQASDTLKPHIAFIKGHREAPLGKISQLINELAPLTDISVIDLFSAGDLSAYSVLCIIAPQDSYSPYERKRLSEYMRNGGRMFIALNHAVGQISENQNSGFINRTGIEDWLEEKGLKIRYDFVVDNNCSTIAVKQHNGFMSYQNNVSFPYLPIITNFSKHTITHGLNSILMPFASSIQQVKTNTTYIFTPLATTSAISGRQQAPIFFNLQKQWSRKDFNQPHNIVAALLTNDDNNSAIVTVTDADFLINDVGVYAHPLRTDNINFAINSIEWLGDNSGLIRLRNKFATFASLEPIDENTKIFLKYFLFLLPIAVVFTTAAIRFHNKRRKRINRARPGYI